MKKHLLFLSLLILSCSLFCSCIQDDGSYDDWKSNTVYLAKNGEKIEKIFTHEPTEEEIAELPVLLNNKEYTIQKTKRYKHNYKSSECRSFTIEIWTKYSSEDIGNYKVNDNYDSFDIEEEIYYTDLLYFYRDDDYIYVINGALNNPNLTQTYIETKSDDTNTNGKMRLTVNIKGIRTLKIYLRQKIKY